MQVKMTALKDGTSGTKQRTAWINSNGRETSEEAICLLWGFIVTAGLTNPRLLFLLMESSVNVKSQLARGDADRHPLPTERPHFFPPRVHANLKIPNPLPTPHEAVSNPPRRDS